MKIKNKKQITKSNVVSKKDPNKVGFIDWLFGTNPNAHAKEIPLEKQVANANKTIKKQWLFRTLQNPEFGVKYFNQLYKEKEKPTLYVNGLTKFYGRGHEPTICDLHFEVKPGQFHAFIGSNGSGKTTTIKSIVGAYSNWNGTIMINGIPNTDTASKKFLGYFPERAIFPEGFNTYEYLVWMAKMNGQNNEQALKTVDQILQDIGITDLKKRNPNSFSSGQKKKVLLAQSLLTNPSILIMDEPTAMLDPGSRRDLFNQIERLRKLGKSIFISSHVLSELEQYADSVTVIDKGRLVFTGSIEEINKNIVSNLYAISTNNQPDIKSFCSKHDIKLVPIKNLLCVEIKNEHDKQKLMDFMHVHKITLDDWHPYKPTLEDVYDKLIALNHIKEE